MENQEQKENYQQKIESQLDEWRADIDRLREKAKGAKAETKLKDMKDTKNTQKEYEKRFKKKSKNKKSKGKII